MLKQFLRFFFQILLLIIMLSGLIWHELVIYGISQGKGQLSIVRAARPIAEVLAQDSLPDDYRKKLILINEIKTFAFDSLGIDFSENYSTFYDQRNKPLLLTVSACEPYAMKPKEWRFPFLGKVSYKGFFNPEKAQKESLDLRMKGYDIDVYSPSGWSTLGWFKDPVLSNMLKKNEGSLSNLIIHELTHGTLFVKNNVTFNENLANFIGDKGAERFLLYRFGKNSKQFKKYEEGKEDDKKYNEYILRCTAALDSLYSSPEFTSLSDSQKKSTKKSFITAIVMGVYNAGLHSPKSYFNYTLQSFHEGNAFFMAFSRYDSQYEIFEKEFKELYHSDLKKYMEAMKEKYPSL